MSSVSRQVLWIHTFLFSLLSCPVLQPPPIHWPCGGWGRTDAQNRALYVFRVESSKLLLAQFMSSFNGRFLSLSLARSLMLRMILYECVFVCVSVGCIMFGIVFIVLFEQYTLSNLCFTFLLISSLFKTQVDVHFAGLWFKLFVFVYPRGAFVCVSLVCICDVRIFCCCYSVIQIITNKYSLSLSVLQFDSTSFTLLGNGAPTNKKKY